jgi:uncharacterized membrane protein|tara:strand:- start:137 stop:1297 length:1161 start_codon:yes stop_codon:yes gene_type:complete
MKKLDLFRPESFIAFYLLFLILAGAGFLYWKNLTSPTIFGVVFALISLAFFYLGVRLSKKFKLKKLRGRWVTLFLAALTVYYSFAFAKFFYTHWIPAFIIIMVILWFFLFFVRKLLAYDKIPTKFYTGLIYAGLAFLALTFMQIGGIPLLKPSLRLLVDQSWSWGGAIFCLLFGYIGLLLRQKKRMHVYALIIAATAVIALTGFRIVILLFLLSGTIAAYKNKKLDNKTVVVPLIVALLFILFLGYYISPIADPGSLLLWRAGSTHSVYEQVLEKSMPFGVEHGQFMMHHARPRDHLANFLGAENSLTSTMLGPALMEFGPLFALAWMLFLGFILGNAHNSFEKKESLLKIFYPVLLALSIVWIETGFDQYMLWFVWTYLLARWLK